MKEIPLSKFVQSHGQTATAKKLGVTQGAVMQMLRSKRDITIVESHDGLSAYEIKPVGNTQRESLNRVRKR